MARPPIQAVIETQDELDPTRRNWRMVLFNEDGTPFSGGGSDTTRRAIVDAATSVAFPGLVTDETALFELVLDGVVNIGADSPITARPNVELDGDYTSVGTINRTYLDGVTQVQNASAPVDVGLVLAYTGWATNNEILATARLMLDPAKHARCKSSFVLHPDSNSQQVMSGECASFLKVKQEISDLLIHFGGGTFTGRVSMNPIPN